MINEEKLLSFMEKRMAALKDQVNRDIGGGLSDRLAKWYEVKYWKEAIERKEFHDDPTEGCNGPN